MISNKNINKILIIKIRIIIFRGVIFSSPHMSCSQSTIQYLVQLLDPYIYQSLMISQVYKNQVYQIICSKIQLASFHENQAFAFHLIFIIILYLMIALVVLCIDLTENHVVGAFYQKWHIVYFQILGDIQKMIRKKFQGIKDKYKH